MSLCQSPGVPRGYPPPGWPLISALALKFPLEGQVPFSWGATHTCTVYIYLYYRYTVHSDNKTVVPNKRPPYPVQHRTQVQGNVSKISTNFFITKKGKCGFICYNPMSECMALHCKISEIFKIAHVK